MEPSHGDGSGEPFAPCAAVLRPAGLRQTGDGTGFCQLSPYTYVASYLWARYGFSADALIHFGTHGSLEYTPRKLLC